MAGIYKSIESNDIRLHDDPIGNAMSVSVENTKSEFHYIRTLPPQGGGKFRRFKCIHDCTLSVTTGTVHHGWLVGRFVGRIYI